MDSVFEWAKNLIALVVAAWKTLRQRSAVKEDTIALKDATIEQKDATIEHLEKISSAPLASKLEVVTQTLNKTVGERDQLEEQLQAVSENTERQRRIVAGAVFIEAYLAIGELRIVYQSAAGGFDALNLPNKMNSVAEEFFKQGERALGGQEIDLRRVKEVLASRKS